MKFVSGMFCSVLTNREVVFIVEILCRSSALGNEVKFVAFLWKSAIALCSLTKCPKFMTVSD